MKRILSLAAAAAILGLSVQASADPIILPTIDYDPVAVALGACDPLNPNYIAGESTSNFVTAPPPTIIGTLDNCVFFLGGLYYYVHQVNPATVDNIKVFNTGFAVLGFTPGDPIGWSYSEAFAAGGTGTIVDMFAVLLDDDGTLDWVINFIELDWDSPDPITFFFTSTNPPGINQYNLINSEVGTANSFAPGAVPEPATLLLLGSGLLGLRSIRSRRKSK